MRKKEQFSQKKIRCCCGRFKYEMLVKQRKGQVEFGKVRAGTMMWYQDREVPELRPGHASVENEKGAARAKDTARNKPQGLRTACVPEARGGQRMTGAGQSTGNRQVATDLGG